MKNNNFKDYKGLEFITSLITFILLLILTLLQYQKQRPFWWILLLVSLVMGANAFVKYKKFKEDK